VILRRVSFYLYQYKNEQWFQEKVFTGLVWLKDKRYFTCINTRKNRPRRMWVGDNEEVFTGAVRVKSEWSPQKLKVETLKVEAGRRLPFHLYQFKRIWRKKKTYNGEVRSIQERTVPAGCEWAMIRKCSLEQSEWSPEKLKVEAGRRLSFHLYQFKKIWA
jgi:hypothetical protein